MKAKCNECSSTFDIKIERIMIDNDIYDYYFRCKKCDTTYHSYFENTESLKLQKLIDDVRAIIKGIQLSKIYNLKTKEEKIRIKQLELDKLIQKKKKILEELENKYKDYEQL